MSDTDRYVTMVITDSTAAPGVVRQLPMRDRPTASYVTLEQRRPLPPEVLADAHEGPPHAGGRLLASVPIVRRPAQCRCADPQTVIVSTGPVLCSTCGRRIA